MSPTTTTRTQKAKPSRVQFPSPAAPALPRVSLGCPSGWSVVGTPSTALAVARRKRGERFRSNVTVSVERVGAAATVDGVATAALEALWATYSDISASVAHSGELSGLPARTDEYALIHPTAGALYQVQVVLLTAKLTREVRDAVVVYGTCHIEDLDREVPVVQDVIASLKVGAGR